MFERFTDRARRVLVYAQDEAQGLGHNFLGTEHLLLGMLREGEGLAAKALLELGVDLEELKRRIGEVVQPAPPDPSAGKPPFTPRAKHVLELSLREALTLGHNYIGTEHLLLGLIREGEGLAAQVLVASGVRLDQVRNKVIELLSGYAPVVRATPAAEPPATTTAGAAVLRRAKAMAGTDALASHHFLTAILEDPDSRAARVLASLGATPEALEARLAAIGPEGTSDEVTPTPASRLFELSLGDGITLRVDDPDMAAGFRQTIHEAGEQAAPGDLAAVVRQALADFLRRSPPSAEPPEA